MQLLRPPWKPFLQRGFAFFYALSTIVGSTGYAFPARANPVGGKVATGAATITEIGKTVEINQATPRAVIDWRGFDISPGEQTRFNQPSSGAVTLNRVHSATPSFIDGALSANGNVYLVNGNGVFFGKNARVDVSGLLATSADIHNNDFMAGNIVFGLPGSPDASIVNEGNITIRNAGLAGLVAPMVENYGVIEARLGRVQLSSGDSFTLDLAGDGLLEVGVKDDLSRQLVANGGLISAPGGKVHLTAAAARQTVDSLITNTGTVQATAVGTRGGEIILYAAGKGQVAVHNSGRIDASGKGAGQRGGSIEIVGDRTALLAGSRVNASGSTGGGTVKIGGDYQGKGTTPTARQTYVDRDAKTVANALDSGDGGKVIVWADDKTGYYGFIGAHAGARSGDGGFVEVSGKSFLDYQGLADTSSAHGAFGTLLLDPTNITISTGADTGTMVWTGTQFEDTAAASSVLNTTTLQNQLALSNVLVTTASGQASAGNLTVSNPVTWSSANSLTLFADNDLALNASLTYSGATDNSVTLRANNNITSSGGSADITASGTGKLAVTLNSDRDASGAGGITLASGTVVTSNGGDITLGGGANPLTTNARGTVYEAIGLHGAQLLAGGGNINLRGQGYGASTTTNASGVTLDGATLTTSGSGQINITGTGGTTTVNSPYGIYLTASSNITAEHGDITLNGTGGTATGSWATGIASYTGFSMQATGTGNINLTGTYGTSSASSSSGVELTPNGVATSITTNTGAINITGNNTSAAANSYGIGLYGPNLLTIESTGGGAISLTGNSNAAISGLRFDMGATGRIGNSSYNSDISLISDKITYTAGLIQTGTGSVTIRPYTAGTSVGIGTGAGTLAITDTILNNITYGGTLWLGGSSAVSNAGNMTIIAPATYKFNGNTNFLSNGDISMSSGTLTHDGGGADTMNFMASNSILFSGSADITASGAGNALSVVFNSDRDASGAGAIATASGTVITSNGGDITLGGGANPATTYAVGTAANKTGITLSGTTLSAGAGNISIRGKGLDDAADAANSHQGIVINNSTIQTTGEGNISITGQGGLVSAATGVDQYALSIQSTSTISTVDGDITLTGTGANSPGANYRRGVSVYSTAIVETTGTGAAAGNITIVGQGGAGAGSFLHGLNFGFNSYIRTVDGDISFTQTTGAGTGMYVLLGGQMYTTGTLGDISITANDITEYDNLGGGFPLPNAIGNGAMTGDISLVYNTYNTGGGADQLNIQTAGDVSILPRTAGTTVGIGDGAVASSTMDLSDAFLSDITWGGTLSLGGDSTVNDSGNTFVSSTRDFNGNVNFMSGANLSFTGGTLTTSGVGATVNWNFYADNTITTSGSADITAATTRKTNLLFRTDYDNSAAAALTFGAGSVIDAGGGNVTLTADSLAHSGSFTTSGGTLTVQPNTGGRAVNLGTTVSGLDVDNTEFANLGSGWTSMAFGNTGAGTLTVNTTSTFSDPTSFVSNTGIMVGGALSTTAASDARFTFSGPTALNFGVDTSAATGGTRAITFGDAVTVGSNVALSSGNGNITFSGTVNGAVGTEDMTITAGTGNISFASTVGAGVRLGDITVASATNFSSAGAFNVASFTQTAGTGTSAFSGAGLNATGDIDITNNGGISGTLAGVNGDLDSGAGTIAATVSFSTLDISGAGATLLAGYVGTPGTASPAMANRIAIDGQSYPWPAGHPSTSHTFAGFQIGFDLSGSGGGGGSSDPVVIPDAVLPTPDPVLPDPVLLLPPVTPDVPTGSIPDGLRQIISSPGNESPLLGSRLMVSIAQLTQQITQFFYPQQAAFYASPLDAAYQFEPFEIDSALVDTSDTEQVQYLLP